MAWLLINTRRAGTKGALHHRVRLAAGRFVVVRVPVSATSLRGPFVMYRLPQIFRSSWVYQAAGKASQSTYPAPLTAAHFSAGTRTKHQEVYVGRIKTSCGFYGVVVYARSSQGRCEGRNIA